MTSSAPASENQARTAVCDLAAVGATVDIASTQISRGIVERATWLGDIRRADLVTIAEASAVLEEACRRVLRRRSIHLPAQLDDIASLARATAESDLTPMRVDDAQDAQRRSGDLDQPNSSRTPPPIAIPIARGRT
jgi:hypothetical protein